jgi:citrate lyase beta subunit
VQIQNVRRLIRSKLFVPAIRPDMFPKALASGADAVCFDLEDSVPAARRDEARKILSEFLNTLDLPAGPALLVRVNSVASADFLLDLDAAVRSNVYALSLPKVESVAEIHEADEQLSRIENGRGITNSLGLQVTIESPRGLRLAADLAMSSSRILGLQLGFADLLEPLGISSSDSSARNQIRFMLRLAAAEANVDCYESAYTHFRDEVGFLAQLQDARALGFAGASCIHPDQVAVANQVFTPTTEEVEYARGVMKAFDEADRQGSAVASYQGKMIDRPLLFRARAILSHTQS